VQGLGVLKGVGLRDGEIDGMPCLRVEELRDAFLQPHHDLENRRVRGEGVEHAWAEPECRGAAIEGASRLGVDGGRLGGGQGRNGGGPPVGFRLDYLVQVE
jgi:hypothetical protein